MISFWIPGVPQPGGSKRAFLVPGSKWPSITDDCKGNKGWRKVVATYARRAYQGPPWEGPLILMVQFRMPRPKFHKGTGRNLQRVKLSAPKFPTTKPDATKLLRAVEDALTGILWKDDAQIVEQRVWKTYELDAGPGCWIEVEAAQVSRVSANGDGK